MNKCIKPKSAIVLIAILVAICSLATITVYAYKYEIAAELEVKSNIQNKTVDGIDHSVDSVSIDADLIR